LAVKRIFLIPVGVRKTRPAHQQACIFLPWAEINPDLSGLLAAQKQLLELPFSLSALTRIYCTNFASDSQAAKLRVSGFCVDKTGG